MFSLFNYWGIIWYKVCLINKKKKISIKIIKEIIIIIIRIWNKIVR